MPRLLSLSKQQNVVILSVSEESPRSFTFVQDDNGVCGLKIQAVLSERVYPARRFFEVQFSPDLISDKRWEISWIL